MKTKSHPLIKELQLGKSPEELVREHFVSYDFQGDVYDRLPDIVREIVRIGNERLRFAVRLRGSCNVIILGGSSDLSLEYWDYDRGQSLEDDAHLDCGILNEIVERIYGVSRKKSKIKLTKEQFLKKKGQVCPYCGHKPEVLDDETWSDRDILGCRGCGETWEMLVKVVITGFRG